MENRGVNNKGIKNRSTKKNNKIFIFVSFKINFLKIEGKPAF